MEKHKIPQVVSDHVLELCSSSESVSTLLAKDPTMAPGDAWKNLYAHHAKQGLAASKTPGVIEKDSSVHGALERATKCGNWGPTKPSDLFLQMYNDALCTLDDGLNLAMVSPPLMGSCGTLPLTVISVIPDIVRHMSNIIVRAEREVYLATNYWQNSVASKFLTNAIRELSRRAGEKGTKIVLKIIYDRGSPKQLVKPHYVVSEDEYTGKNVALPHPNEIPHIDMEVVNYHQPMLGTFHAKYMVVDRKIAILQSNNIQDNDNMEMMVHLEGPIVDSLYDMALISWHMPLKPPLPSHNSPAAQGGLGSFGDKHAALFNQDGTLQGSSVIIDPAKMNQTPAYAYERVDVRKPGVVDGSAPSKSDDIHRSDVVTGPSTTHSITHPHPHTSSDIGANTSSQNNASGANTQAPNTGTEAGVQNRNVANGATDTQAETYFEDGQQAIPPSQIQNPTSSSNTLPEHSTEDQHYDDDIAGEVARVQTEVSPKPGETRMESVTRLLNHTTNKGFKGSAPECAPQDEMTPYIPHATHEPFPIAMVCRAPAGAPNHKAVVNPQNAAWLSALRNAKKNVFIQTPTLNAAPLVPAIAEACERGIDVYCYVCLGYNDTGELLPGQGGHNEMIAHKLYAELSDAGKQRLHYFWYIGKDQVAPIPQSRKKRSCHIKLMIVDEHIGIMGNGNQDTQSWYHSQEINVMLDSADVCKAWIDGIRRNQNTHIYGALDKTDGVWRDKDGKEAEGAMGVDPGHFSWAKGFVGAIKRVQGTGGF